MNWRSSIDMALSNIHIDKIVSSISWIKPYYIGTFPSCGMTKLPKKKKIYCFITNVHHHEEPGLHWNAWFCKHGLLYFFDSFGRGPLDPTLPHDYRDLLSLFNGFTYFKIQLQPKSSFTCGYYCLHFLLNMSMGLTMDDFKKEFSSCVKENDKVVVNVIESLL